MERKEPGALLANLDPEGNEGRRVPVESEGSVASRASLAQRATLVEMAPQGLRANGVLQGLKDLQDSLDQKAPQVHQERTGCQATLGREARQASKARRVPQGLLASLALRVLLEKRGPWGSAAILGLQDHLVNKDSLVWLERKAPRVTQDRPAFLERTVQQV